MSYRDITLSPDDIEWDTPSVWGAARKRDEFEVFIRDRGLTEAIRHFHKAHRAIADKLIQHGVRTGKEFPEASAWIYAARAFKSARKKATRLYRDRYGQEMTTELQRSLNSHYPRFEARRELP